MNPLTVYVVITPSNHITRSMTAIVQSMVESLSIVPFAFARIMPTWSQADHTTVCRVRNDHVQNGFPRLCAGRYRAAPRTDRPRAVARTDHHSATDSGPGDGTSALDDRCCIQPTPSALPERARSPTVCLPGESPCLTPDVVKASVSNTIANRLTRARTNRWSFWLLQDRIQLQNLPKLLQGYILDLPNTLLAQPD